MTPYPLVIELPDVWARVIVESVGRPAARRGLPEIDDEGEPPEWEIVDVRAPDGQPADPAEWREEIDEEVYRVLTAGWRW